MRYTGTKEAFEEIIEQTNVCIKNFQEGISSGNERIEHYKNSKKFIKPYDDSFDSQIIQEKDLQDIFKKRLASAEIFLDDSRESYKQQYLV